MQNGQSLGRDARAAGVALNQFRGDGFAGQNIDQSDVLLPDDHPADQLRKEGDLVNDDHRHAHQAGLQRRRSGGHDGQVAAGQDVVSVPGDDFDIQAGVAQKAGDGFLLKSIRQGQNVLRPGDLLGNDSRRLDHFRQELLDFRIPAPGQQADGRFVFRKAEVSPGLPRRERRFHDVAQGMSDVMDVESARGVKIHFKRQNHGHLVHQFFDLFDASLAPGPHLRADVVKDPDASFSGGAGRDVEVEIGKIDQDDQARLQPVHGFSHFGDDPKEGGGFRKHFRHAHHRNVRRVRQQLYARFLHAIAADAEKMQRRIDGQHFAHEQGAVQIAGGLSGDDHHFGGVAAVFVHDCLPAAGFNAHDG